MFKIPAWEDDNQGNKVPDIFNIPKVKKKQKKKNSSVSPSTKQNGVTKPSFKTKNNKRNSKINSKKNSLIINNVQSKVNTLNTSKVVNSNQTIKAIPSKNQTNHAQEQKSVQSKKQKRNEKNRKKNSSLTSNVNSIISSPVANNKPLAEKAVAMEIQTYDKPSLKQKQAANKNTKSSDVQNKQVAEKAVPIEIQSNHDKTLVNRKQEANQNTKSNKIRKNKKLAEKDVPMEVQTDHKEKTTLNKKLKQNKNKINKNKSNDKVKLKNNNTVKLDELILIENNKKLNKVKNDTIGESVLFNENSAQNETKTKIGKKKEFLKSLLEKKTTINHITVKSNALRNRMLEKLKAAKFRYLNEKLYTTTGSVAQQLFKEDPAAFQTYHEGYQQQMKKWPVKPLDVIIQRIQKMPKSYKIVDMGCGEAELSKRVGQAVRSFDLVARADGVEECDIAHTPILATTMDVAVYCLALMGTNLTQYLLEANRVLRMGGHLLIAEVESRFNKVEDFVSDVQKLGFSLKKLDSSHEVFYFMEFTKIRDPPAKKGKIPHLSLKPCIYKKR